MPRRFSPTLFGGLGLVYLRVTLIEAAGDFNGNRSHVTFVRRLLHPTVTNERELRLFVVSVALACVALALMVDVANQLAFFVDVGTCLRSWTITVVVAAALAAPISRAIGKAHLDLYRAKMVSDKLSRTDQLTGLLNRRALMEAVPADNPSVLALVITDIDRFKSVNDTYGNVVGDEVIRSVAQRMAAELSGLGLLARIGGEEFALLCAGPTAEALMERLAVVRDRISATPIMFKGLAVRVTISAGVAVARTGEAFDQLYSAADHALYAAKAAGRNRVVLADAMALAGEPWSSAAA
jgi:diguanylate cyclase (GGDEF)-like protein